MFYKTILAMLLVVTFQGYSQHRDTTHHVVTLRQDQVLKVQTENDLFDLAGDLIKSLLPALLVALISLHFQSKIESRIKTIESQLTKSSEFYSRKLNAHEKLWPLIANAERAQATFGSTQQRRQDTAGMGQTVAIARKELKNFFYDNELYFSDECVKLVQDLDTDLANPDITDVRARAEEVKEHLKIELQKELR